MPFARVLPVFLAVGQIVHQIDRAGESAKSQENACQVEQGLGHRRHIVGRPDLVHCKQEGEKNQTVFNPLPYSQGLKERQNRFQQPSLLLWFQSLVFSGHQFCPVVARNAGDSIPGGCILDRSPIIHQRVSSR